MTEDPSATSTTADSTSWQGGDASGVGTEDWGYYGEDWYQSGCHDSFTSYCVEHNEWSNKMDRQDDISHVHENAKTELTVHAFGTDTEGTHKETKSEQTSLVSFCAQHSEQSFLSSVIDLSREPTFVILDTGCTRSMGSRHAVNRLMQACSKQEPNLIWFKTVPCRSMFTFANGETSVITQRLVMYFARSNGSSVSTTIDILDKGKVPILFSIQQMRNLEFELMHTAAGEFLTCQKFGLKNFPLSVSTSDHTILNVLDLARADRQPVSQFCSHHLSSLQRQTQTSYLRQDLQEDKGYCRTTGQAR